MSRHVKYGIRFNKTNTFVHFQGGFVVIAVDAARNNSPQIPKAIHITQTCHFWNDFCLRAKLQLGWKIYIL